MRIWGLFPPPESAGAERQRWLEELEEVRDHKMLLRFLCQGNLHVYAETTCKCAAEKPLTMQHILVCSKTEEMRRGILAGEQLDLERVLADGESVRGLPPAVRDQLIRRLSSLSITPPKSYARV
jgi:hypothetical protein